MSPRPPFATLSVEKLRFLASIPSGPDAAARSSFLERLYALGLPSVHDDRFCVVDESIVELGSYTECCNLLLGTQEQRHPIDQVWACVVLLRRHETADVVQLSHAQVQARLSQLLVEFPVLLHPRLVFRFSVTSGDEWLTLGCALAESSAASLPMTEHGVSQVEVERFAAHHSVRAGLTLAGSSSIRAPDFRGRTPLQIATSNGHNNAPATPGATRGAFLASLLRLSSLHGSSLAEGLIPAAHKASAGDTLYQSLGNTFWGVLGIGGWEPGLTRAEFVLAMQGASPFDDERASGTLAAATARGAGASEQGVFCHFLALKIDAELFADFRRDRRSFAEFPALDRTTMRDRTQAVLGLLVEIGVFPSFALAAQWLARCSVGHGRMAGDHVPSCSVACAIGFLEAVDEHGVRLEELNPAALGQQRSSAAQQAVTAWSTAIAAFNVEADLRRVIAATPSAPSSVAAPRRRIAEL